MTGRAVVLEEVPGWDEVLLGGVATPCEGDRGVTGREEVEWGVVGLGGHGVGRIELNWIKLH